MSQTVAGSPRINLLQDSQQEGKPSTPAKTDLTNGEPQGTENASQKPERDLTLSVSGK